MATVLDLMRSPHNLAVALRFASSGFLVFPCHSEGDKAKAPRIKGWQEAASADEAAIRDWWSRWPDALVGLHLAAAGLIAIDADRHGGPDGVAAWDALVGANCFDPSAYPAVATPTEGRHVFMRCPPGWEPSNGRGELPAGVDVRAAGYTIASGCELADGRRYEPLPGTPPLSLDIAEAPQWLVTMIGTARRAADATTPACELDTPATVERAVAYLASGPPAIEGSGGDETTLKVACVLKDFGVSSATALDLMAEHWNDRCSPPWDVDELAVKVENAYRYGQNPPGILSPSIDFAGVELLPPRYIVPATPPLEWSDDPKGDKPIQWLLKGILPRQGVAIIYGPPKSGKSFVALDLSARLANGLPWFNVRMPKEALGALLLLGESAGTVRTRLNAFRTANAAPMPPLAWATVANLASAAGIATARRIIGQTAKGMAERGTRLGLIVVDTLASALGLEDENSAPQVTAALKALEALAIEFDVAVLGIHHAGKSGQDRGSSAFRAACDVMLSVERGEALPGQPANHRQLAVVLNRNGEGDWTANFRLDRVVLGIDEDGDEITSCVVRPTGEPIANVSHREIIMGLFDPATIHINGFRLLGDEWGITRREIRTRCAAVWDDLSPDAVKKRVQRAVAELIQAGRLKVIAVTGCTYLVAIEQRISGGGDVAAASLF